MASRLDILNEIVASGRQQFTSVWLRSELGLSAQATSNLLARWERDGLVDRVMRGSYIVRPIGVLGTRAASQDIALAVGGAFAGIPHRIAFRSALDYHGLISHPARTIIVATSQQRRMQKLSGRSLRLVLESEETIAIEAEIAGSNAMVSTHLRSLVEAAMRPELAGGHVVIAEALLARKVDSNSLVRVAQQLNASAAIRRIGSLADHLNIGGLSDRLRPLSAPRSDIDLDTQHTQRKFRDAVWCVRWPVEPSELKGSVSQ